MKLLDPSLTTNRLILRRASPAEAPEVARYLAENRAHMQPWEPLYAPSRYSPEFWIDQLEADLTESNLRLFLFKREQPDRVIGIAHFSNFLRGPVQFCNLGYQLDLGEQGRGYMCEALQRAIGCVFDDLNVHRIQANYMPHNRRSGALLRRLGFIVEGYARDYLYINGAWEDHILTSLTNDNWRG
ncbi:MAG TPA: GNAT family N-acetyltransferase [Candidatus Dormibacteraeota bacterium]|nr:GNAT family N-acetyltransferase [Candidatus Dormibacteraeota bacterium]